MIDLPEKAYSNSATEESTKFFFIQGEWLQDKKHGKGIYTWPKGDTYDVLPPFRVTGKTIKCTVMASTPKKTGPSTKYFFIQGYWVNNQRHGFGKFKWKNGDFYEVLF